VHITDNEDSMLSKSLIDLIKISGYGLYEGEDYESKLKEGSLLANITIFEGFDLDQSLVSITNVKTDADTMAFKLTLENMLSRIATSIEISKGDMDLAIKLIEDNKETITIKVPKDINLDFENKMKLVRIFGFSTMFVAFTSFFISSNVINEKKDHTFQRMVHSPQKRIAIILGYIFSGTLMGFLQWLVTFTIGKYLMGISYQNTHLIVLSGLMFSFAMASFGIFMTNVFKSIKQFNSISPIILTSFAMLGGCMWPLEMVTSKSLIYLSYITPHRFNMESLLSVGFTTRISSAYLNNLSILLGIGVVYTTISIYLLSTNNN
jgi:ABC-2 type transport system permease protein